MQQTNGSETLPGPGLSLGAGAALIEVAGDVLPEACNSLEWLAGYLEDVSSIAMNSPLQNFV